MTAQEMFEELGYKLTENNESKLEYTFKGFIDTVITFNIDEKIYWTSTLGRASAISNNIHKAINKQCEGLGWQYV